MKTTFLSIAFALLTGFGVNAQTTNGTKVITGSIGYRSYTSTKQNPISFGPKEYKTYSYNTSPSFGVFIKDQLELGIQGGYYVEKGENNSSNFYLAPYLQKYYSLSDRIFFTGTGSVGYSLDKYTINYYTGSGYAAYVQTDNTFNVAVSPGIVFFASEKIGFKANLGALRYSKEISSREGSDTEVKTNNIQFNLSPSNLNFGLSYYINR